MTPRRHRPLIASYRLQLTPSFGFDDASRLVASIEHLGASHLYLSPIAEAVAGSQHGYDVVDPRVIRQDFGGEAGLERLLDAADQAGLGVVIDHVPNHVSVERPELNPFWWAVLRDGPGSEADRWFDIDWEAGDGQVIVPRLGEPLADLIAAGAIEVGEGDLGPEVRYGPLRFPIAPGTEHLPVEELLEAQHYRLSWWRDPARNVRRFFTIDDLTAVRVEHDDVRTIVDSIPARLCDHPAFDGVRVDHVDGLADPGRYLQQLRETIGDRWLLIEKILGPGEQLPTSWPVDGTTGYEHITTTEHLMLDDAALPALDGFWVELNESDDSRSESNFQLLENEARREVLADGLRPDLDRLLRTALAEGTGTNSAPSVSSLRAAVVELTVSLDRYRTYLPDDKASVAVLQEVSASASQARPELAEPISWFVDLVNRSPVVRNRWEQLTGPAMAKGAEDCAFYRHQRLSSLCEVGGQPGRWSISLDEFHDRQAIVQAHRPTTMLTATTHDTKRSSGVRARSLALAARPDTFVEVARSWIGEHQDLTGRLSPADVTLAIQIALTSQPIDVTRLSAYLVKAAREAALMTLWTEPDAEYERALGELAERLVATMADPSLALTAFGHQLVDPGVLIGLRLTALHLTCPGVPDLYQGAPFELLSLVDPDNRRLPDWDRWRAVVNRPDSNSLTDLVAARATDDARVELVRDLLALRRRHTGAFGPTGSYQRLPVTGPDAEAVVAFRRWDSSDDHGRGVVVVVLRPTVGALDLGATTVDLGGQGWTSLFGSTGDTLSAGASAHDLLGDLGLAVLEGG